MDDQSLKTAIALYAALLSTILALVKIYEAFWKDRIRLTTTYSFNSRDDIADEITIVNLSSKPAQVSHWSLKWEPKRLRRKTSAINVTPSEALGFAIPTSGSQTLYFEEMDRFDWSYRTAGGRKLVLTLNLFGQRRALALVVHPGL